MQCTPNALQWCTHNALHPNLNICTRTRNALGLYQIPFNKVKEQCTSNALLRTPTHSMSDILACTANALFNRKGIAWTKVCGRRLRRMNKYKNIHPGIPGRLKYQNKRTSPITGFKNQIYHQISNIRRANTQHFNVSRLVLQLSLPKLSMPGIKLRMKM